MIKAGMDVGSVEFWGEQAELLEFAEALTAGEEITLRSDVTVRPPWERMAEKIRIVPAGANEKAKVWMEGEAVVISGGREDLRQIAEGIWNYFGKEFSAGTHFHLDWFDGSGTMAEGSLGMVIRGERAEC